MNAPVPSVSRGSPWVDKGLLVCRRLLSRCASRCALCHAIREECSVRRTIGVDSTSMWKCLRVQRGWQIADRGEGSQWRAMEVCEKHVSSC
jgi:hypothetical protein